MQNAKAHTALLFTNLFFAVNFIVIKLLVNGGFILPFALNLVRVIVTVVLLWLLYFIFPVGAKILKKDYGRLFLCALTGVAINQLLFVKGLSLTYSIHASLLMLTTPILITIGAAWVLKETPGVARIAGLLLGITGASILVLQRTNSVNAPNVFLGDVLIILNAVSYSVYFILVKPLMKVYDMLSVIRMIFTMGLFIMLPFCWQEFLQVDWNIFGGWQWLQLFLVVFCGTFLAYVFNIYGLQQVGASVAGSYIYIQPVFVAVVAGLLTGEEINLKKLIAGLLIASGVYLSTKNKR